MSNFSDDHINILKKRSRIDEKDELEEEKMSTEEEGYDDENDDGDGGGDGDEDGDDGGDGDDDEDDDDGGDGDDGDDEDDDDDSTVVSREKQQQKQKKQKTSSSTKPKNDGSKDKSGTIQTKQQHAGKRMVDTKTDAAKLIYQEVKDRFKVSNEVVYYKDNETHVWKAKSLKSNAFLEEHIMESNIYIKGKGKPKPLAECVSAVRKSVLNKVRLQNEDDHWIRKAHTSSLGKLLLADGYWDFLKGIFFAFDDKDFDTSIIFFARIGYAYKQDSISITQSDMDDVKTRYFHNQLGKEMGDSVILMITRALAGESLKNILFCLGMGDTGKSILALALQQTFRDYIGDFNGANLAIKKNNGSQDEAQQLRWVMPLKNCRIAVSNELKNADMDGNKIKMLTSGGHDSITGRSHCQNETSFKISFLPIVFANDVRSISPKDDSIEKRLRVAPYNKVFVKDPENEFQLKKDDNVGNEVETLKFKLTFLHIVIEKYKEYRENNELDIEPKASIESKANWFDMQKDNFITKFLYDFEFTNKEEDYVTSPDITDWSDEKNMGLTSTKIGIELRKYAKLQGFGNVTNKAKRVGKKTVQVWYGVKQIVEVNDE
jgi:hypothetical protein